MDEETHQVAQISSSGFASDCSTGISVLIGGSSTIGASIVACSGGDEDIGSIAAPFLVFDFLPVVLIAS